MSLVLPIVAGFMVGMVAYIAAPLAIATVFGGLSQGVREHYFRTSMTLLGRAMAIKRKHSGWTLKQSSFDASVGKEKVTLNGETKHFEDPENLMSEFYGRPFAIGHEKSGTIINPRFAELGETLRNWRREGDLFYDDGSDTWISGFVRIADENDRLVNIDHALALVTGDAQPGTTEWSVEITKKSQDPFESGNMVDYVGGLVAFGTSFGAFWLASEVVSSSGGGSTLPLVIDVGVMFL